MASSAGQAVNQHCKKWLQRQPTRIQLWMEGCRSQAPPSISSTLFEFRGAGCVGSCGLDAVETALNAHLAGGSTRIRNDGREIRVDGNGREIMCYRIL